MGSKFKQGGTRTSFVFLGIKHVVVAINKMDIVDWSEERFEEIRADYANFAAKLDSKTSASCR